MGRILSPNDVAKIRILEENGEITKEEAESAVLVGTPVLWIETYLCEPRTSGKRLSLRSYQCEVFKPVKSIALRWGRQSGKEQPYSAKILTPNGFTTMGEIQVGDQVITMDGTPAFVTATYEQGVKDVYRLEFTDGSWAECGLEHLWLCRTKKRSRKGDHVWRNLTLSEIIERGGMNPDSDVAIRIPLTKPVRFSERDHTITPYVLGALLGDGGLGIKGRNLFTSADLEIVDRIQRELPAHCLLRDIGNENSGKARTYSLSYTSEWHRTKPFQGMGPIEAELIRLELKGTRSGDKFIPWEYLHDSVENRTSLLRGLMDTDGYAGKSGTYEYVTKSPRLAEDFIWLVQSLGGKVKHTEKVLDGKVFHRLMVRQLSMNPFYLPRKADRFYQIKYFPTRTLKSITLQRQELSKCIMVDHPSHTYLTDNFIVTHNTVVLAARLIWEAVTEPNINVGLYAPRKKHIKAIFDYIEEMLKGSSEIQDYVMTRKDETRVKKPADAIPRIEFANGSKIMFFHTQTKTATEQIRGTPVDKVFIEEAHYINDEAMAAIAGVITSSKDVFIWAQSTPRGKSGWFFEFSTEAEYESHHTSRESPDWNDEKEKAAKLLAPDSGSFAREYLAEWVSDGWDAFTETTMSLVEHNAEQSAGDLVHREKRYMSSQQIRRIPGEVFIGVDWNIASNGVKITIFRRLPGNNKNLTYQETISIEDPEYTQLTAVDRLFQILRENKVCAIAVDKGYAATTVELLSKGLNAPEFAALKQNFHVVDFNRVVLIPKDELFSNGQMVSLEEMDEPYIKISVKTFVVGVLNMKMLSGNLSIGPVDKDTERRTLLSELRAVKVERISANGYPVYTKKDLHKFSGAMLAVYAAFMFDGEYGIVDEEGKPVLRRGGKSPYDLTALLNYSDIPLRGRTIAMITGNRPDNRANQIGHRSVAPVIDDWRADGAPRAPVMRGAGGMRQVNWTSITSRTAPSRRRI